MPLKINVKAGEKIVINGAVITMGEGATYLVLQNHATFLREKDIMQPEDANTPMKKIYFSLMLMYLDQENYQNYYAEFMDRMMDVLQVTGLQDVRDNLMSIFKHVQGKRFFQALKQCRSLVKFEQDLLDRFPAQGAAGRAGRTEVSA
ncbi:MAG: flagellar biosynthesis repressor FlbT [Thalassobaculales bacterium]